MEFDTKVVVFYIHIGIFFKAGLFLTYYFLKKISSVKVNKKHLLIYSTFNAIKMHVRKITLFFTKKNVGENDR